MARKQRALEPDLVYEYVFALQDGKFPNSRSISILSLCGWCYPLVIYFARKAFKKHKAQHRSALLGIAQHSFVLLKIVPRESHSVQSLQTMGILFCPGIETFHHLQQPSDWCGIPLSIPISISSFWCLGAFVSASGFATCMPWQCFLKVITIHGCAVVGFKALDCLTSTSCSLWLPASIPTCSTTWSAMAEGE